MSSTRKIVVSAVVALSLPLAACGLFRRGSSVTTSVSSNVEVNQEGRDIATLQRDEYEVIGTSVGEDKSRMVYILTIPVGSQNTSGEGTDNAYYDAVDRNPECDAITMPRVETRRIIIPLLLVNIVVRKTRVKGRCIHVLENDALVADDDGGSDTGGGPSDEPIAPAPMSAGDPTPG